MEFSDGISHISPSNADGKLYRDTEAFQSAFIKGVSSGGDPNAYTGDEASLTFVANYLDCLTSIEVATGMTLNGSILFDYDADYTMPLDPDRRDLADFFKIAESNTYVESSVKSDTGAIGGGKSYSSDNPWSGQSAQETAAPAMAAKRDVAEGCVNEADGGPACVEANQDAVLDQGSEQG